MIGEAAGEPTCSIYFVTIGRIFSFLQVKQLSFTFIAASAFMQIHGRKAVYQLALKNHGRVLTYPETTSSVSLAANARAV